MPVITVVGSLNVDMVTVTDRVPGPGETLIAKSFSTGWGGKGANQAVAAHRLSREARNGDSDVTVRMFGAVGDDPFGAAMLKSLSDDGLDVEKIRVVTGTSTGTATILVEEATGENRILVTPGANGTLNPDQSVDVASSWYGDVVLFQLETPLEAVVSHIHKAVEAQSQVILNPAPAVKLPNKLYPSITHLILNTSEVEILCDLPAESLSEQSDLDSIASTIIQKGVRVIVITLGGEGAYWQTRTRVTNSLPGVRVPARKVQVVDTTAAGDTFVGAYAVAMARATSSKVDIENDVESAVQSATLASAKTVQKRGAQDSIPWSGELKDNSEKQS